MTRSLPPVVSLAVIGACGIAIDAALLALLAPHAGAMVARIVSGSVAALGCVLLFRISCTGRDKGDAEELLFRYGFVRGLGGAINIGLTLALLHGYPVLQPLAALAVATLAATGFAVFGYRRFLGPASRSRG